MCLPTSEKEENVTKPQYISRERNVKMELVRCKDCVPDETAEKKVEPKPTCTAVRHVIKRPNKLKLVLVEKS